MPQEIFYGPCEVVFFGEMSVVLPQMSRSEGKLFVVPYGYGLRICGEKLIFYKPEGRSISERDGPPPPDPYPGWEVDTSAVYQIIDPGPPHRRIRWENRAGEKT